MTDYDTESVAIRAVNLSKRFLLNPERRMGLKERIVRGKAPKAEPFWALKDATFDVPRGSMFGIVGHNGSGKSTALKVVAGIYRPTSGTVDVNGRMSALLELGAGFHPELTGRENIRLNGAILGMTNKQIEAAMDDIVDFAGLGRFIDSPIKTYSSGMYVRLGFAIAVKVDPEILIIDEVIAVGDEDFQRKCFDYIHELRKRGSTVVIVTHSLNIVSDRCDYAMWLDHGEIRALGSGREIVDLYLGKVNEEEEARQAHATVSGDTSGRSTSPVTVTGVRCIDRHGNESRFLTSGQPGAIEINYEASEATEECGVGLSFYSEAGVLLSRPDTGRTGLLDINTGTGTFRFEMPNVPFAAGNYQLSTAVIVSGHQTEIKEKAFDMKVRGSAADEDGLVRIPGHWSFPAGVTIQEPPSHPPDDSQG